MKKMDNVWIWYLSPKSPTPSLSTALMIYDRTDDFYFSIVYYPFLCSNIPESTAYGVFVMQLIRYPRACLVILPQIVEDGL